MSDRDLMQQALDAMMTIRPYEVVDYDQLEASITALRQALETEHEWVGLTDEEIDALSQARSLTDELMDCVEACTTWCGLCGRNPWHRNQP